MSDNYKNEQLREISSEEWKRAKPIIRRLEAARQLEQMRDLKRDVFLLNLTSKLNPAKQRQQKT